MDFSATNQRAKLFEAGKILNGQSIKMSYDFALILAFLGGLIDTLMKNCFAVPYQVIFSFVMEAFGLES